VGDCYDFSAVHWDEKLQGYVVDTEAHTGAARSDSASGKGH